MQEKKCSPLAICHLVVMAVVAAFSLYSAIRLTALGFDPGVYQNSAAIRTGIFLMAAMHIANMCALICCVFYARRGYQKEDAAYYKTFLVIMAVACVLAIIASVLFGNVMPGVVFMGLKILLLLILAFLKDMGKLNTLMIFFIMLLVDVIYAFIGVVPDGYMLFKVISTVSNLLINATVLLAIRGKYADKEERGAEI